MDKKIEITEINKICYYINVDEKDFTLENAYSNFFTTDFLKRLLGIFSYANAFGWPLMLIVCTQNSKSCYKQHFQHMFSDILFRVLAKEFPGYNDVLEDIHLIDKGDATATSNSTILSCLKNIKNGKEHPINCRTRIYGNKKVFFKKSKNSNGDIVQGELYKRELPMFNLTKDNLTKDNLRTSIFESDNNILKKKEKSAFIVKCEKRIISLSRIGVGGILFNIILQYKGNPHTYIICNSNLPKKSSDNILNKLKENLNYKGPLTLIMANTDNNRNISNSSNSNSSKKNIFLNIQ